MKKKTKKNETLEAFSQQANDWEEKLSSTEKRKLQDWNKKVKHLFNHSNNVADERKEDEEDVSQKSHFQVFLLFKENTISIQSERPVLPKCSSFEIVKGGDVVLDRSEELEIDVVCTVKSRYMNLGILTPFARSINNTVCLEITCEGEESRNTIGLSSLKSRLMKGNLRNNDSLFSESDENIEMSEEMLKLGSELESMTWFGEPSSDFGVYLGVYGSEDRRYVKIFGVNGMVSIAGYPM